MKLYKMEVYVYDFEDIGTSSVIHSVENDRYCTITVMKSESVEINDWSDDHELNKKVPIETYRKYFGTELKNDRV